MSGESAGKRGHSLARDQRSASRVDLGLPSAAGLGYRGWLGCVQGKCAFHHIRWHSVDHGWDSLIHRNIIQWPLSSHVDANSKFTCLFAIHSLWADVNTTHAREAEQICFHTLPDGLQFRFIHGDNQVSSAITEYAPLASVARAFLGKRSVTDVTSFIREPRYKRNA